MVENKDKLWNWNEMKDTFNQSLISIQGIGEKRAKQFQKLGVDSVDALLHFYPRDYEDWSNPLRISEASYLEKSCIQAKVVTPVKERRVSGGLVLYTFQASDGVDNMSITLFNNQYAAKKIIPDTEYLFYGRIEGNMLRREMKSPQIELLEKGRGIHPIYRQTAGLNSKYIAAVVQTAFKRYGGELLDDLPDSLRAEQELCHIRFALEQIHFPKDMYSLHAAQKRLVFEELLYLSLGLLTLKSKNQNQTDAILQQDFSEDFYAKLPFIPTLAQKKAVAECVKDMESGFSMNRLLQGDVGSGKTAVAACLMYDMVKNGYQSTLLAPTEILAIQHYHTLTNLLADTDVKIELLTGSTTAANKRKIKERLQTGETDIVVGTHAVLQKDVAFRALGLIVTDEQHRFGVAQRLALAEKGSNPHVLVMSATPIPRTLALSIYSDLEISVLDELPKGRQPIETYVVKGETHRQRVYRYVKKHLDRGLQGYIVCPLVKENENGEQVLDLKAAEGYYEDLSTHEFSQYRLGLLHGKMKPKEKEAVMKRFSEGEIQLLISTVVIEVGVDVPKAAIMVIENAERFGLSQLHQLRGRVGRGKDQSTCILITDSNNEKSLERLNIIRKTNDGFQIAEEDLRLRGPGNFFGYRQHGLPELKLADMFHDIAVLEQARGCAQQILEKDKTLSLPENTGLKKGLEKLFEFDEFFVGKTI